MSNADWVPWYFDLLEENARLQRALRESIALNEDLLADPLVRVGQATMRLSEWEDAFWDFEAPLVLALGFDPLVVWHRRFGRIETETKRERHRQAIRLSEKAQPNGGVDL